MLSIWTRYPYDPKIRLKLSVLDYNDQKLFDTFSYTIFHSITHSYVSLLLEELISSQSHKLHLSSHIIRIALCRHKSAVTPKMQWSPLDVTFHLPVSKNVLHPNVMTRTQKSYLTYDHAMLAYIRKILIIERIQNRPLSILRSKWKGCNWT